MALFLLLSRTPLATMAMLLPFLSPSLSCRRYRCCYSQQSVRTGERDQAPGRWNLLLDREWLLPHPATKLKEVYLEEEPKAGKRSGTLSFHVIRDDLLHPIMGGNKLRKLDAIIPFFQGHGITDVVTCGGSQSAHTAAVAVACAEHGMRAHLLLRGERPVIPTGYNLVAGMYGQVTYIPRSEYSERKSMLQHHAVRISDANSASVVWLHSPELCAELPIPDSQPTVPDMRVASGDLYKNSGPRKIAILNEGAGESFALLDLGHAWLRCSIPGGCLGLIRLVDYLSQPSCFGKEGILRIVVDCGTGTTAVGLALGIVLFGLHWQVVGVMLADNCEGYKRHAESLLSEFRQQSVPKELYCDFPCRGDNLPIIWRERCRPRKFGKIYAGEIGACQHIAQSSGILLDPIYTLAGWEVAQELCCEEESKDGGKVALLHTGGTLGLFGLAQRFPHHFE